MHLVLALICGVFVSIETLLLKSKIYIQADFNCKQIRIKQTSHGELWKIIYIVNHNFRHFKNLKPRTPKFLLILT